MGLEKELFFGFRPGLLVQVGVEMVVPPEIGYKFTFHGTVYLNDDITDIFLSLTD